MQATRPRYPTAEALFTALTPGEALPTRILADAMGVTPNAIRLMRSRGVIPSKHVKAILRFAEARKIKLTHDDIPTGD